MNRIICIGNRFIDCDSAGPKVYDALSRRPPPQGVEYIEGGTAGLNLLGLVDGAKRIVFVDSISGFLTGGGIGVLRPEDIRESDAAYSHGADLPYLLRMIPAVCDRPPSVLFVVGIEGDIDDVRIAEAAFTSLQLVSGRAAPKFVTGAES